MKNTLIMIILALVLVGCDQTTKTNPDTLDTILAVCHRNDGIKFVKLRDYYPLGGSHVVAYDVTCADKAVFSGQIVEKL